jgi:hypothetical protein
MRPDDLHGRGDVPRLGHDVEILLRLEQHPQAAAHDRMVVRDDYADRLVRHGPSLTHPL